MSVTHKKNSKNFQHRWSTQYYIYATPFQNCVRVKVNCTLVQALRLCTGRTVHRGSRGVALPCHDHGTRRGWGVSITPCLLFTPGKDLVPNVQVAGWAPVWTGAENLAPTRIQSLDRPACSRWLYWLRYPALSKLCNSLILRNVMRDVLITLQFRDFQKHGCPLTFVYRILHTKWQHSIDW